MDQQYLPLDHEAWSRAWYEPEENVSYALAHRLANEIYLKVQPLGEASAASEEVYAIPELRMMVFKAMRGVKTQKLLARCMRLDGRGFATAMPLLYRSPAIDTAAQLTHAGVSSDRLTQYLQAIKEVSAASPSMPSLQVFTRYQERFPGLQELNGHSGSCNWKLRKTGMSIRNGMASPVVELELTVHGDSGSEGEAENPVLDVNNMARALRELTAGGIQLVDITIYGLDKTTMRPANLGELFGGRASLAGLRRFYWGIEQEELTWEDMGILADMCPRLQRLDAFMTDFLPNCYFAHPPRSNTFNIGFPRFPHLTSIGIQWQVHSLYEDQEPTVELDEQVLPALEAMDINLQGAIFFGLLEKVGSKSNRDWTEHRSASKLQRIRELDISSMSMALHRESTLFHARTFAKLYHPRCLIGDTDCNGGDGDQAGQASQWLRDVTTLRDELVNEELLNMEVGWRHVPQAAAQRKSEVDRTRSFLDAQSAGCREKSRLRP